MTCISTTCLGSPSAGHALLRLSVLEMRGIFSPFYTPGWGELRAWPQGWAVPDSEVTGLCSHLT